MTKTGCHVYRLRGIALLELMLSLTVVAALLFAVMHYYGLAQRSRAVQQAAQSVQAMRVCAEQDRLIAQAATVAEDHRAVADDQLTQWVSLGCLPSDFVSRANPWGGATRAWVQGNTLRVTLQSVPRVAGMQLVAMFSAPPMRAQWSGGLFTLTEENGK